MAGHSSARNSSSPVTRRWCQEAGRQVGAHVGVEPGVLHRVAPVVVEPAAVGQLALGEPAVGALGLLDQATDGERHRRFDVVPRIAVAALEPRDHAVAPLDLGDGVGGGQDVGAAENARHFGNGDLAVGRTVDRIERISSVVMRLPPASVSSARAAGHAARHSGRASGSPATDTAGLDR